MRSKLLLLVLVILPLWGCNDDPIIGPTDDTGGGGSYGVIHFSTAPEDAPAADTLENENPELF